MVLLMLIFGDTAVAVAVGAGNGVGDVVLVAAAQCRGGSCFLVVVAVVFGGC